MKNVHQKNANCEIFSPLNPFSISAVIGYDGDVFAKSKTESGNSNNKTLANSSTPLNRAFFVRSTSAPKERHKKACSSMVACNGKGSPFAVFQSSQFSSPLHAIAQTLESLAIASQQPTLELSSMLYRFLTTGEKRLKITIYANSKAEALSRVQFTHKPLLVARLGTTESAKKSPNQTACNTEQNHRLQNDGEWGYDECTTTIYGNRNRQTSGIFLPQIYQHHGDNAVCRSEFAVRATPRNKASIRTNKGGCYMAVVEPLSPPISDKPFSLTKTIYTMKTQNPNTAQTGVKTAYPTLSSRFEGVIYA